MIPKFVPFATAVEACFARLGVEGKAMSDVAFWSSGRVVRLIHCFLFPRFLPGSANSSRRSI